MAQDIAELGISVDSSDVVQAKVSLDDLAQSGAKAEKSAQGVGNEWSGTGKKVGGASTEINKGADALKSQQRELDKLLGKIDPVTKKLNQLAELERQLFAQKGNINSAIFSQYQAQIEKSFNALAGLNEEQKKLGDTSANNSSRLKDMVAQSLAAQQAQSSLTASTKEINSAYAENARAQTQAMQAGVRQQQSQKNISDSAKIAAQAAKDQQEALKRLAGQIDPTIAALDRLDQQEKQLRGFRATGALDEDTFQQFSGRIQQSRNALTVFDDGLVRTGNTAKQTQQALRQLPAQFSDIFVSLQAGQSPLTVFLQQGSQIKDSFGGIGAALRETGKFALAAVNPYTLAAAAAIALGVAWKQGSDQAVEFNKALILSGNASGTSVDQLQSMAVAIDQVTGTQRQASAALAEVAASGKFAAEQIEDVARAAVAMENATGKAVSDTVAEFKRLADEPTAAAAKLNEQYNFLTASIFEQIAALEQQGDAAGAAQIAIEAFGASMEKRADEIEGSLGLIEKGWRSIKNGAAEAWDEMLGVGREKTLEEQLQELNQTGFQTGEIASKGAVLGPLGAVHELYEQISRNIKAGTEDGEVQLDQERARIQLLIDQRDKKAANDAAAAKTNKDSIAAQLELNKALQSSQSNAQKLQAEYSKIDKLVKQAAAGGVQFNNDQIQQLRAAAEKQFGEKPEKVRAARVETVRDDAATKLLLDLREQQSALELQLSTSDKLTAAEKERAKFTQQIADLQSKDILTAEQQSLLANQDAIKAQLDKNVAIEQEIKLRDDALKLQDRAAQITKSIEAAQASDEEQRQRQLDSFGLGSRARKQVEEQAQIRKEFQRFQEELVRDIPEDQLGSDQYKQAVQEIENSLNDSLAAHQKYYDDLAKEQEDWLNGAKSAFADYIDSANDLAGQTNDLIGNTLSGLEDAFVDFAVTGKTSFKDLADSIIADIIRIGTRLLISEALGMAGAGGKGGTKTNGLLSSAAGLLSSIGGGAGSYTGAFRFEGGGWTGPGERAGGVDGRGGFFAMLHPNETVVDHTRSGGTWQQSGGSPVNIGSIVLPGVSNKREAREAGAVVARQITSVVAGSTRYN